MTKNNSSTNNTSTNNNSTNSSTTATPRNTPAIVTQPAAPSTTAGVYNLGTRRPTIIAQIQALNPNLTSDYLNSLSDDRLMDAYESIADRETNYDERSRDRQDTMKDFNQQLSALTGSKQRQAEQAGRIAQAAQRTQGLASMMQNF